MSAEKVRQFDIVGFSQGGAVARDYLRFHGVADRSDPPRNKVHTVITLGATNHGTTVNGLASVLSRGWRVGDTDPGIEYTVIATKYDKVSTPPEATFLAAGAYAVVHNVFVQNVCPADRADHRALTDNPVVARLVELALATPGVETGVRTKCAKTPHEIAHGRNNFRTTDHIHNDKKVQET
ncbi:hypothetical protein R3Q06_33415 [Rhodococcus erythropolis]|uniref:lipase family alpha/beta hydrolase n=1 Tax=Rhodococcus erythropolis TaxID=1833 RepID=UPI002949C1C1|nr:hypothetical protein [Rhodococcus erythropolis]MDV6278340.1 hypothetical protein [Rhodococcus erythropolis]